MFKRILVPLDGTPESAVALPLARTVARATGGRISLLRVASGRPSVDVHEATAAAQEYLNAVADELGRDELGASCSVRTGDVAGAILGEIRTEDADLVVLATHGRSGLTRAVLGSVTEDVITHSPVPVLTLRPGGKRISHLRTVLVAVDGTAGSATALQPAIDLARCTGARLVLLEVVEPLLLWASPETAYVDDQWEQDAVKGAKAYIGSLVPRLRANGVEAAGRVETGPAGSTIRDVAREIDADMIIASTRAHQGMARTFLGSVTDQIVRRSKRPVLVVRRTPVVPVEETAAQPAEAQAAVALGPIL